MSIFDEPNPDAPEQQPPIVLQRGAVPGGERAKIARLVWNVVVAFLLFVALLLGVAGGVLLGGAGGGLIAAAVGLAYIAHLIDSA